MTTTEFDRPPPRPRSGRRFASLAAWRNRLVASPRFQSWAAAFPLTRRIAKKDGERLFDLVSGFVYSQVLLSCVELDLFRRLQEDVVTSDDLAREHTLDPARMRVLCQAAAALGLLDVKGVGYRTGRLGAAFLGVPGLEGMVRHHSVFYRDLADPIEMLRGDTETGLAAFWPYVFGATGDVPQDVAETYSQLMTDSQALVAEETLRTIDLTKVGHLLDVGGGAGAFIGAVARVNAQARFTLFDLPTVQPAAEKNFADLGLRDRVQIAGGSFRTDPLPLGADTLSLVRVLYDHRDETVFPLLAKARSALPSGGRIVISEPMSGGLSPQRAGDAYFGFYCMAMQTGTVRSANRIAWMLSQSGFEDIKTHKSRRPFVTSVVTARC